MTEKLWSECSPEEHQEVNALSKRIKKLKKYLALGYLSKQGEEYFTRELMKDINKTERKYRDGDSGKSV